MAEEVAEEVAEELVRSGRRRMSAMCYGVLVVLTVASGLAWLPMTPAAAATGVGGAVVEGDGQPVQGVAADLFVSNGGARGRYLGSATTDSSGRFAFVAEPGCYVITVTAPEGRRFDGSRWYQRSVCVEADQSATIAPAILDSAETAEIGGSVSYLNGDPAGGVFVDLFRGDVVGQRQEYLRSTRTETDGSYRFLVGAGCYVVTFIAPDGESFGQSRYKQTAACVDGGEVRAGLDAVLDGDQQPGSNVAGTVSYPSGVPVEGVEVTRWATGADGARTTYLGSSYTAADGTFDAAVAPGCYWLIFVAIEGVTFGQSRYLERSVCVGPGESVTGLDATADASPDDPLAELEARWAEARAAVVAEIESQNYGVTDGVLVGPGGFNVDLSRCPATWSDAPGDGERIVIAHTAPLSGVLASYGNLSLGMLAYIDYVNETGGIGGRPIDLVIHDDGYVATRTIEVVEQLLANDDPFAVVNLGSPGTFAVQGSLNQACVPQPFAISGHPALGDPVGSPWSTGLQLSWATEARLWGTWIEENLADELPVKVVGLVMDHAIGRAYQTSFEAWADEHPEVIASFETVVHDAVSPTVTAEMEAVADLDPDVFLAMTAGNPCLLTMLEAERLGLTESVSARFTPSLCREVDAYMIPAGSAGEGFLTVDGGLERANDPVNRDDPYFGFVTDRLQSVGFDTSVDFYGTGFAHYGWPLVETLRIAAELDGGLTRSNFLLAQRAVDLDHPAATEGVRFAMNGTEDGFFIEGSTFSRYDATLQAWVRQGPAVDLNGTTPNCPWRHGIGC